MSGNTESSFHGASLKETPQTGRHAILPGVGLPPQNAIAPLLQNGGFNPPMPDLDIEGRLPEVRPNRIERAPDAAGDTETLLNALIGECHFLMREVAFRCIVQTSDPTDRIRFMSSAMNLAETGAKVAETIGRLRGGVSVSEKRQRMIFEHVHTATGGGGRKRILKTMIKRLRPHEVWQPKLGAPKGNRNARKHGRSDAASRALAKQIAGWRRRVKRLVLRAQDEIAAGATNTPSSTPSPTPARVRRRVEGIPT